MGKSLNGKELGKGITQNRDGLFVGRFTDRFGKRRTFYDKSLRKLMKKLRDAEYENDKCINLEDTKITLDEWFDTWINVYKAHCRETTVDTYTSLYKGLSQEIGWCEISKLNPIILQKTLNGLKSDALRAKSKAILNDMMTCAMDADMVRKNPAKKLKTNLTGEKPIEKHVLSDDEIERFKNAKVNPVAKALFILGLNSGMRIGEMLALTWDDVDFDNGEIHVNKCLRKISGNDSKSSHFNIHTPKTMAGYRTIPMTKEAKEAIEFARDVCGKYKMNHDPLDGFENLIFVNRNNHPINNCDIIRVFERAVDKIDGVQRFTPHCLRHTFATKCIAKGMKPKILQKILGHANIKMTMDLYCHVEAQTLRDDMGLIGELA